MSAKAKKPEPTPERAAWLRLIAWLLAGPPRGISWSLILLAVFGAGGYALWRYVEPRVTALPEYRLSRQNLQTTPLPEWIRTDPAGEVLRSMSLDGSPRILERDLAQRLHEAFAAHPWVAKVVRVSKHYPARVHVEMEYRRPVCMIEVPSGVLPGGVEVPGGLLPVDAKGVLLPDADFTPLERRQYPRVASITSVPRGSAGSEWGDPRVTGSAEVAAVLIGSWNELGLDRIVPSALPGGSAGGDEFTFELFSRGGSRVLWGRSPSTRWPGEMPSAEKIARLKRYVTEHGSLEGARGPQDLDLRQWNRLTTGPRGTARVRRF
jgi:hypothetical protein